MLDRVSGAKQGRAAEPIGSLTVGPRNAATATVQEAVMSGKQHAARLGSTTEEYDRLGISRDHIEPREDGMRTDGSKGTFEWWYFDAHLADGSKLVITFYTKDVNKAGTALLPYADIVFDGADGRHVESKTTVFKDEFSASADGCDVRIGPNRFVGDLHTYEIHIETDEITADVSLSGDVPAWRPETGYFLFEEDESLYFAWLPSVPQGQVEATVTIGDQTTKTSGVGYHDHNWGNVDMMKVINNWYWGRGQAGPYTVIACYLTAEQRYGFTELPIYMLAKDGKVIADDNARVGYAPTETSLDEETKKPVSDLLTYTYDGDAERYVVTWRRQKTILRDKFIDDVHGFKHLMAQLIGFDGAYLRFSGALTVERFVDDALAETETDEAIWELMYFGKNHEA